MNVLDIHKMSRDDLLGTWKDVCPGPVPHRMSTAFLRQVLCFEAQARMHGGFAKTFRQRLGKAAAKKPRAKNKQALQVGSRLLREWNGITHSVEVTDRGFAWNGKTYRSLSVIARTITGAHWSGPRFFGLGKTQ